MPKRQSTLLPFYTVSSSQNQQPNASEVVEGEEDDMPPATKKVKERLYDNEYVKFGFTVTSDCPPRPQCFLCGTILANSNMKPASLQRHFLTKHSFHANKPTHFFHKQLSNFTTSQSTMTHRSMISGSALRASFEVAMIIAQTKQPFTIAENVILPACAAINRNMVNEEAADIIKALPLSDTTIARRIDDMAEDIINQVTLSLQEVKYFSIQIDESTDISSCAMVLCYVRFLYNNDLIENVLFCKELQSTTTGEDIFDLLNSFFEKHGILWNKCYSICTDGAAAMTGQYKGAVSRIKKLNPLVKWVHCVIHREALAARSISSSLNDVLQSCITIVNCIKAKPLNNRLFKRLCEELGCEYKHLLLHTDVRWLSRGRMLQRIVDLQEEVRQFLLDVSPRLALLFNDAKWLLCVTYLSDLFTKLNDLNLGLQGVNTTLIHSLPKIQAFTTKLNYWKNQVSSGTFDCFPQLDTAIINATAEEKQYMILTITEHLHKVHNQFLHYFPDAADFIKRNHWVLNPFSADSYGDYRLSTQDVEVLIDIAADSNLKDIYSKLSLAKFWNTVRTNYKYELAELALETLLPFASTYLCETTFSTMCLLKCKKRNRLNVESQLIVATSNIKPRLDQLCSTKQSQVSH